MGAVGGYTGPVGGHMGGQWGDTRGVLGVTPVLSSLSWTPTLDADTKQKSGAWLDCETPLYYGGFCFFLCYDSELKGGETRSEKVTTRVVQIHGGVSTARLFLSCVYRLFLPEQSRLQKCLACSAFAEFRAPTPLAQF